MNLIHINYCTFKYKSKIKQLYLNAFPKDERFPFWILKHSAKNKKSILNAILDDDKFVGMEYIVNCDDAFYLMYFAIDENLRNNNYGSRTIVDLKERYKTIFLSIERSNDKLSIKRKNFYIRNGFFETNKYYEDNGIQYEVLCTNKNYKITEKILKQRYNNMTDSVLMKYLIGKIFNTKDIKFTK